MINKNIIKNLLIVLAISQFFGCSKEFDLVPEIEGIPAGGMLRGEVKSVEGGLMTFRVDLFAVNHYGRFIENLETDCFSSDDDGYDVNITGIKPGENENAGPYSVMLLFDQSGSISSTDPQNARIDAGKAFTNIMGKDDEAALSVFPQSQPYSPFTDDKIELSNLIETMRGNNGGGTPLYSSIYSHINYVCNESKNDNRAIIVFTDGQGSDAGFVQSIIDSAQQCDIKVYTIGLGDETSLDFQELFRVATGTGGAVMYAQEALQLVTLYNSLSDFLHGDGTFYETCWEARKVNGLDWVSGESFVTTVYLKLPTGEIIQYPIQLFVP